tara:strand:- start:4242 stop:4634 length:393 start_codon:yes stop_codon:yes gene_type:complete
MSVDDTVLIIRIRVNGILKWIVYHVKAAEMFGDPLYLHYWLGTFENGICYTTKKYKAIKIAKQMVREIQPEYGIIKLVSNLKLDKCKCYDGKIFIKQLYNYEKGKFYMNKQYVISDITQNANNSDWEQIF